MSRKENFKIYLGGEGKFLVLTTITLACQNSRADKVFPPHTHTDTSHHIVSFLSSKQIKGGKSSEGFKIKVKQKLLTVFS